MADQASKLDRLPFSGFPNGTTAFGTDQARGSAVRMLHFRKGHGEVLIQSGCGFVAVSMRSGARRFANQSREKSADTVNGKTMIDRDIAQSAHWHARGDRFLGILHD